MDGVESEKEKEVAEVEEVDEEVGADEEVEEGGEGAP